MRLALAGLVVGLLAAVPANAADGEMCQGKPATIVQATGTVNGTDGDDVIVGGAYTTVLAGAGDDTVCVTGHGADGGSGVDSVQLIGAGSGVGLARVVDFEVLEVSGVSALDLRWTRVPRELAGTVALDPTDGGGGPSAFLRAPKSSPYGLRVNSRAETVALGTDLSFTMTGAEEIVMNARTIRAVGSANRDFFIVTGCDVVAKGGAGDDGLSVLDHRSLYASCDGARLLGQGGNDRLGGSRRNDTLIGGKGRDRANGYAGADRCVAERKWACER